MEVITIIGNFSKKIIQNYLNLISKTEIKFIEIGFYFYLWIKKGINS